MRVGSVLSRYVVREVVAHAAGVMAVVLGIFLVRRFSSLLAAAAEGLLPADVIVHLLGLRTLMALPSLLPVVLYLAVLLALGRLHQDSEIQGLAACGVAPARIRRPVLLFAVVAAAAIAGLALSARPWAAQSLQQVKREALRRLDVGGLVPGRFYALGQDDGEVIFAEGRTNAGLMEHVFVQDRNGEDISILYSAQGFEQLDEKSGYRFLTLVDGTRYDLRPEQGRYEVTQYRRLVVRTTAVSETLQQDQHEADSTGALFRSGKAVDLAELQWRLAMPVSAMVLVLLALPLSQVDPFHGKYAKLLTAVLIYVVYRHLLGAARDWLARGLVPIAAGLWPVHAVFLVTALILLAREPAARGWRRALAHMRSSDAAVSRAATGDPTRLRIGDR